MMTECLPNFRDVRCLGAFWPLHNFELDRITLLQCAIPISNNRRIMDEDVWAIFAPDEPVAFRIVKPLHRSLHLATLLTLRWDILPNLVGIDTKTA